MIMRNYNDHGVKNHLRGAPEEDESIEVVRVRLENVPRLIASGEMQDCKSIASLMLALARV